MESPRSAPLSTETFLDRLHRWAQAIRTEAFQRFDRAEPLARHLEAAAIHAGLGPDGYRVLFEASAEPEFAKALETAPVPDALAAKDSVYLVITTKCNNGHAVRGADGKVTYRTCGHCLNGSGPHGVSISLEEIERIVAHLPFPLREVEISGGEVLHPDVFDRTLHTIRLCAERYGPRLLLSIQTNGDFLRNPRHARTLLGALREAGLRRIVVASMDIYHGRGATVEEKFEERKRHYARVAENLRAEKVLLVSGDGADLLPEDPTLLTAHFFGADIQHWFHGFIIDDLVPNVRARRTGLVDEAEHGVRYCDRHAGARGFLGSPIDDQVAVNGGPVYPCCWFTAYPLGDARKRPIPAILRSYVLDPLALAQHLGVPRRASEIVELVAPHAAKLLRDAAEEERGLNECIACRRFTERYANVMRDSGHALYRALWREIPVPWNHETDPEWNAAFASWVEPRTASS